MRARGRGRLSNALFGEHNDQARRHGGADAAHGDRRHQDLATTLQTGMTKSMGTAHAYVSADDDNTLRPIGSNSTTSPGSVGAVGTTRGPGSARGLRKPVESDDMGTVESDGLADGDRSGVDLRRPESGVVSADWRQLGTAIRVVVTDPAALSTAQRLVHEELCALDLACSRFRADSELVSVVDAAGGRPTKISALLVEAIAVALGAAEATNGEVDPTVGEAMNAIGYDRDFQSIDTGVALTVRSRPAPGWRLVKLDLDKCTVCVPVGVRLDLGATAKALSADRAATAVAARVGCGVLVSLGGDVCVAGPAPQGGWQIRVQEVTGDPAAAPIGSHSTVTITTGALATSSTTARRWVRGGNPMHHIIDPRIGLPAVSPWRTVSVAAPTCVDANTAATAAIVRGEKALLWLDSLQLPARLVRHDGTVCTVAGWPADDQAAA